MATNKEIVERLDRIEEKTGCCIVKIAELKTGFDDFKTFHTLEIGQVKTSSKFKFSILYKIMAGFFVALLALGTILVNNLS